MHMESGAMDLDTFRTFLDTSGVDVWSVINTAISVALLDYGVEMKDHRSGIIDLLYARGCETCDAKARLLSGGGEEKSNHLPPNGKRCSPYSPRSFDGEAGDGDHLIEDPMDDEQTTILAIKEHLEHPHQPDDFLMEQLQTLADMDVTFKALKETDIGRHVNRLRKHSSNEVRKLVKQLVRKWKDLVDEWVKLNSAGDPLASSALIADGDSPPRPKVSQNGHSQVVDFSYSPIPHNGSFGCEKNNGDPAEFMNCFSNNNNNKAAALIGKQGHSKAAPVDCSSHPVMCKNQEVKIDSEIRLASARKRLQQNYLDAENAKKQRTIRVMGIDEIPKPKNGFIVKNKGTAAARH